MFGGGSMADWMERSALGSAANLLGQALMHVEQAQRAQPLIENLPRMQVAQGFVESFSPSAGDVFFDFTTMIDKPFFVDLPLIGAS